MPTKTIRASYAFRWLVFTAAILLLQFIPFTNILLMFVLAPFWSIFTVNWGFATLALEALTGRVNRAWLVLPFVWFVGYAGMAFLSHQAHWRLDAQYRQMNKNQKLAFSASKSSLVFQDRTEVLSGVPMQLVQNYDIDVIYKVNSNSGFTSHSAYRIGGKVRCKDIYSDPGYSRAGVNAYNIVKDMCVYYMPEDPSRKTILVSAMRQQVDSLIVPYVLDSITVHADGREQVILKVARAALLSWIPMPILGCALNSGAPKLDCAIQFWRNPVETGGSVSEALAEALGLKAAPASTRRAAIEAAPSPSLPGRR